MISLTNETPTDILNILKTDVSVDSLNGRHLNVCVSLLSGIFMAVSDSSSVKIESFSGNAVFLLDWLSHEANFTFDLIFDIPGGKTFYSLLAPEQCDFYTRGNIQKWSNSYDFLHPYFHVDLGMLIPMPEALQMNLDAVWKPFQPYVWLVLLTVAIPVAAIGLAFVDYRESGKDAEDFKPFLKAYMLYTLQILLSQGGNAIPSVKWKLRLAAGAWLLSAFVLITAYSSVLISFILAPQFKPLIENIKDLAERDDVNPVFVGGLGSENFVMSSPDFVMKQIAAKLNAVPGNRVKNITYCYNRVKLGRSVCIDTLGQFYNETEEDYQRTGKCLVCLKREKIGGWFNAFMVNKNSSVEIKEALNQGVLKAVDAGFTTKWNSIVQGKRPHCYDVADVLISGGLSDGNPSLSMRHLTGPFVILLVGYALAIWTFILEKIINLFHIQFVAGRQVVVL